MKLTRRRVLLAAPLAALVVLGGWVAAVVTPAVDAPPQFAVEPGAKLWSFGFVGDTHAGRGITDRIFAKMREADLEFVLHLGDLVDRGDSDAQWEYVLSTAAENRLRLMPVVGNHDKEKCYRDRGEIRFRQYFPHLPSTFYHFEHRGLNFVMLNSESFPLPGSEQRRFLEWQLAHHRGPTVVCQHRPVFTCSDRDWGNMYLFRLWTHGALAGSDTTLVLAGHNHYYERSNPLDGITYVVSGGGAPNLYKPATPDSRTAAFEAGRNHYGLVDVYADHLQVRVLDLDDQPLDEFSVALAPAPAADSTADRRPSTELPPIRDLPAYAEQRLGLRSGGAGHSAAAVVIDRTAGRARAARG